MGRTVSMAGLDLSFMHAEQPKRRKAKLRVPAWQKEIDRIKKRTAKRASKRSSLPCPLVMSDITPFVSPIDGTEITSRSKLTAHERTHDVRQCGDFKPGEVIARENKRIAETKRLAEPETVKWQ